MLDDNDHPVFVPIDDSLYLSNQFVDTAELNRTQIITLYDAKSGNQSLVTLEGFSAQTPFFYLFNQIKSNSSDVLLNGCLPRNKSLVFDGRSQYSPAIASFKNNKITLIDDRQTFTSQTKKGNTDYFLFGEKLVFSGEAGAGEMPYITYYHILDKSDGVPSSWKPRYSMDPVWGGTSILRDDENQFVFFSAAYEGQQDMSGTGLRISDGYSERDRKGLITLIGDLSENPAFIESTGFLQKRKETDIKKVETPDLAFTRLLSRNGDQLKYVSRLCDLNSSDECLQVPPLLTNDQGVAGFNPVLEKYLMTYPSPVNDSEICVYPLDFKASLAEHPNDQCVISMPDIDHNQEHFKSMKMANSGRIALISHGSVGFSYLELAFSQKENKWSKFLSFNQYAVDMIKNRAIPAGYTAEIGPVRNTQDGRWILSGWAAPRYSSDNTDVVGFTLELRAKGH